MRKWLTALSLCLVIGFTDIHSHAHNHASGSFEIGGGYRTGRFHWQAGQNQTVDISLPTVGNESKLRWKNLRIAEVTATFRYTNCANFYFRAFGTAGQIYHGRASDKDFIDNVLITESRTSANKGNVYDTSGGIGYTFRFQCNRAAISPLVGYSYNIQQLRMNHLRVTIDTLDDLIGRVPGLHNSYRTRWKGFWVGVDFRLYMFCNLTLFGSAEYHLTHFRAYGHWNLRPDFIKDFKQHATGHGDVYTLGIRYQFYQYYLAVTGIYQGWHTRKGTDRVYLATGPVTSRLQGAFWHSLGVTGTAGFRF